MFSPSMRFYRVPVLILWQVSFFNLSCFLGLVVGGKLSEERKKNRSTLFKKVTVIIIKVNITSGTSSVAATHSHQLPLCSSTAHMRATVAAQGILCNSWSCWFVLLLVAQMVKSLPAMQKTWVQSLGQEDPLKKEMATHSIFLPGKSHGWMNLVGYSP